ncbi:MAG: PHP domain-containing protein [Clostridia bacterium]|nr:PHP domain-containing protein [Clostridia bacterium]
MRCWYDFHIHTALSPCGDNDMTPNNIVNMAKIKGLDAIAVTDHNSVKNAKAVMEAGTLIGLTVIPGMEIETSEEIHVVALFPHIDSAVYAGDEVAKHLPPAKNRPDIFGEQLIIDKEDNVVGCEEQMLITATDLDIFEVFKLVKSAGGVAYPAHVDRHSYSVLSNLGFIPPELDTKFIEISKNVTDVNQYVSNKNLEKYNLIFSSDAHYLWDISEKIHGFDVEQPSVEKIIDFFK